MPTFYDTTTTGSATMYTIDGTRFTTASDTQTPYIPQEWIDRFCQTEAISYSNDLSNYPAREKLREIIMHDTAVNSEIQNIVKLILITEMERYARKIYEIITEHIKLDITEDEFMQILMDR